MSDGQHDGAGILEGAVLRAVDAAGIDLNGRHSAAVEMCITYARQIDRIPVDAGQDRTKVLYLGPHFMNALSVLGLTPRGEAEIKKIMEQTKLDAQKAKSLKQARSGKQTVAATTPAGQAGPPSSVSHLQAVRQSRGTAAG